MKQERSFSRRKCNSIVDDSFGDGRVQQEVFGEMVEIDVRLWTLRLAVEYFELSQELNTIIHLICNSFPQLNSQPLHCPHLPLFYHETARSCWTPMESLPWCLVIVIVFLVLVTGTDVRVTAVLIICLVTNIQIISSSKCWSVTLTIENCLFWLLQSELVVVTQRKNERLFRVVCCVITILMTVPFEGSEASDFFIELSPDDRESVSDPVANLVELFDTKPIITGSVQQLNLFDGLGKEIPHGGFLFKCTNNLRIMEKSMFLVSKTLGDGLSEELIKLCSQLSQISSQNGDRLNSFLNWSFVRQLVLVGLSSELGELIFELVKDLRFFGKFILLLLGFLWVTIFVFLLLISMVFERLS
jgi:hypothetical protein